eukprot:Skav233969  [mRNA]  locus=scaffold1008:507708:509955:+ [translate_table: standard]
MADTAADNVLMVGNPGTGKSTLLNCLLQETPFKSGYSGDGTGVTDNLQIHRADGKVYMDTPGLEDDTKRKAAAKAISEALRKDGTYQVFFVIMLDQGRVRVSDKTVLKLVTDACSDVPNFCYSVIINQMLPKKAKEYQAGSEMLKNVMTQLMVGLDLKVIPEQSFHVVPRLDDLEGAENGLTLLPPETLAFIQKASKVKIQKEKVKDVQESLKPAIQKQLEDQLAELKKSADAQRKANEELEKKLKEQQAELLRQQEEHRRQMEQMRRQEQQRREDEEARRRQEQLQQRCQAESMFCQQSFPQPSFGYQSSSRPSSGFPGMPIGLEESTEDLDQERSQLGDGHWSEPLGNPLGIPSEFMVDILWSSIEPCQQFASVPQCGSGQCPLREEDQLTD